MTCLCLGGSFNPIHHGHLICARAVAEKQGYSTVYLIPNSQSPHKLSAVDVAPALHRLQMCRLAAAGSSLFEVQDLEVRRRGPSYTLDTVRELKQKGMDQIDWLIGADMVRMLPSWHAPLALLKEVRFVIMARPGMALDWETLPPMVRPLRDRVVEAPLIDIAASQIRRRVAEGKSIDYLTVPAVIEYIHSQHLYGS